MFTNTNVTQTSATEALQGSTSALTKPKNIRLQTHVNSALEALAEANARSYTGQLHIALRYYLQAVESGAIQAHDVY